MAGFNIKQGDIEPPIVTTLSDADGNLVDLTGKTVHLSVKAMAPPYAFVQYLATPNTDQVAHKGQASYDWSLGGTVAAGDFWLEWIVDGQITLPTAGANRLTVWPSLADDGLPSMAPVVSLDDVEAEIGRVLTAAEAQRALTLVDELTAVIEGMLHKDVRTKRRVESGFIPSTQRFYPNWGPVVKIENLTVDGADVTAQYISNSVTTSWYSFRPGALWSCTYVSGMSAADRLAVTGVIRKGVAAVILAPVNAAAGVLQSYNVEGTSITYGSGITGAAGAVGRFTAADVSSIMLRRKPIIG